MPPIRHRTDLSRVLSVLVALLAALAVSAAASASNPAGQPAPDAFERLKQEAERHYAEGSYRRAFLLYEQAESPDLTPEQRRWLNFRLGDTQWREQSATQQWDNTLLNRARERLENLLKEYGPDLERDDLWAFAQRSLGDYWWQRANSRSWSGWNNYAQALDYWAGHRDLDKAREHYLDIVFNAATPTWHAQFHYSFRGQMRVPVSVLENAVKIAEEPDDIIQATYLLAMSMRQQRGWLVQQRVEEYFRQVIDAEGKHAWLDHALYFYGEWLESVGRPVRLETGDWRSEPDYPGAVEQYRRLVREYRRGETPYHDEAQQRIRNITQPSLGAAASHAFLPGSMIQFNLSWRNIENIELSIYRVDLPTDLRFPDQAPDYTSWVNHVQLRDDAKIRSWEKSIEDAGTHRPGQDVITVEPALEIGAYVLVAAGGGQTVRELLLVSDATLVVKSVANRALVYYCDAIDGSPIQEAELALWEMRRSTRWTVVRHTATTNADGLAEFELRAPADSGQLFVTASKGARQAFAATWVGSRHRPGREYRIYAHTDRPAYRPGDTVNWKMTAREYRDATFSTPAGHNLNYTINDPRGTKVAEGSLKLNDFGSAWDELAVTDVMPLGEYHIIFTSPVGDREIGRATLFRLEEYRLPEYEVTIGTGKDAEGRPKTYQIGDRIEIEIDAQYYFGAPVANADVELVIHQRPYWHWWQPRREYPWLYEDSTDYRRTQWYGRGEQVKREQIKTDQAGRAVYILDTPLNVNQDLEYTIEARVVDSSRREITSSGTVRVTRQKYFVDVRSEGNIHRPNDNVEIRLKAQDANRNAVRTTGLVRIFRDEWKEIWISPRDEEITGLTLEELRSAHIDFPPPPGPDGLPWRLKRRGYESELVHSERITTDGEGEATLRYRTEREGYYRVEWLSEANELYPVEARTWFWVCTDASKMLGYRARGVDIVLDRDTVRPGAMVPMMIMTQSSNRHVLFTIEGDGLHHHQLVHVEGNVKLIHVEMKPQYVPNVWLNAVMILNAEHHTDSEQITIPPDEHFLKIELSTDEAAYEPGRTGSLHVRATDVDGNPVRAEIGLSVIDEAIYYIQPEIAGDPRAFFIRDRNSLNVSTTTSFNERRYVRLKIEDEEEKAARLEDEQRLYEGASQERLGRVTAGGGFGGGGGGVADELGMRRRGRAAPGAPMPAADGRDMAGRELAAEDLGLNERLQAAHETGIDPDAPVRVRTDFRATALWAASVITDENGEAVVEVPFPDSTTRWKAIGRAATTGAAFGIGDTTTQTRQPLIVRLQAPRFFVVGDETVISAVINNNTDEPMDARYDIAIEGLNVISTSIDGRVAGENDRSVSISANATARIDWRVGVELPGTARVTVTARAGRHSDGMERTYTIIPHGIEKHIIQSGKARANDTTILLELPSERRADSTSLHVQITPSVAIAMLDALPYVIDYPYGCTEQTLSRFLPAAIVAKTLRDLDVDPALAMSRVFGGITDEFAEAHPDRAGDLAHLDDMIEKGLARLYDFQHGNGAWGWWKESPSDPWMTAYVIWGLSLALEAGVDVDRRNLARGVEWLRTELVKYEQRYDVQAWMLHALAAYQSAMTDDAKTEFEQRAIDNLWQNRDRLNAYTRALFALAVHAWSDREKAEVLVRNLENGVKIDETPDTSVVMRGDQETRPTVIPTAHWGAGGVWWRWSDGPVETTAFALRAILAIQPDHELVEPVINWLVKNRRGAQWSNTRDSAIAILAMNEYLRASGELEADVEYELLINGESVARRHLTPEDLFNSPSVFEIDPEHLRDGRNEVRIVRHRGDVPLYFSANAIYFSEEEPIPAAGHEIFARRDYYKLVPYPTLLKGFNFDRVPMRDGDSVRSGERIEVVLTIETKNDYEYLVFEDLKAAGIESVAVQSGIPLYARQLNIAGIERRFEDEARDASDTARHRSDYTGRTAHAYQELRDRHIAIFFDRLPQGVWEIGYEMRAETPGDFHALPLLGHAMYVPDIRCNSFEMRMTVYDREE